MNIVDTHHFKLWKSTLETAGNTLEGVEPLWQFNVGDGFPFAFAAKVNVRVTGEGRNKDNEFILSRPDISHVVLYRLDEGDVLNSDVVLVREFRSTSRTLDGYIRESPGGSGFKVMNPRENAAKELEEEIGLAIDPERLQWLESKQVCGTFSTHKAHVFRAEITEEELEALRSDSVAHGNSDETERTFVEVHKASQILLGYVDWANTGMILSALLTP